MDNQRCSCMLVIRLDFSLLSGRPTNHFISCMIHSLPLIIKKHRSAKIWESGLHVLEICFVEVGARGGGGEDRDVMDFSCGQCPRRCSGKEFACNAGDTGDSGSIPGLGRSPGGANGNPLKYSFLKSPMGRGVYWVAKSWTQLSSHAKHYSYIWINLCVPPQSHLPLSYLEIIFVWKLLSLPSTF